MRAALRTTAPALVLAIVLTACGGSDDGSAPADAAAPTSAATTEADERPADAGEAGEGDVGEDRSSSRFVEVAILDDDGFRFEPADVTVAAGETVRWRHDGRISHTVTGDELDSGTMTSGDTYDVTFERAGTYAYVCAFHGNMHGTVTVTD